MKDNKEGIEEAASEFCFERKIVIGSCKLLDPKNEKPTAYELAMPVKHIAIQFLIERRQEHLLQLR
jgi:hypothetical protein